MKKWKVNKLFLNGNSHWHKNVICLKDVYDANGNIYSIYWNSLQNCIMLERTVYLIIRVCLLPLIILKYKHALSTDQLNYLGIIQYKPETILI